MGEIEDQSWMSAEQKQKYEMVLYSQLTYLATFYSISLKDRRLNWRNIQWKKVKGNIQKLRILKNLIWQVPARAV